jgi:hypothetical protein
MIWLRELKPAKVCQADGRRKRRRGGGRRIGRRRRGGGRRRRGGGRRRIGRRRGGRRRRRRRGKTFAIILTGNYVHADLHTFIHAHIYT